MVADRELLARLGEVPIAGRDAGERVGECEDHDAGLRNRTRRVGRHC